MPERIIMMHRGKIVEDYHGEMKRRVRIPDLVETFNRVTKRDLFSESAAVMLMGQYR